MTEQQGHFDHSTLQWVKRELDDTLNQSADALQQFSEDANDRTQLQFCVTHLHQVRGILQMLELQGAVMLTEEMEAVGHALLDESVGNHEQACEALMRGILRLRDYLERVGAGEQDSALLILPLINDLRATRNEPIIAASALFAPDLEAQPSQPRHPRDGSDEVATEAARARPQYQRGLLGVLRGISEQRSAERMIGALDQLDRGSPDDRRGRIWWIGSGLVDGLRQDQLTEYRPTVHYLLGRLERYIRQATIDGSELEVADDQLRAMLYYVARADATTDRLDTLHRTYRLSELLAEEQRLEEAREGFFGPGAEAFSGVADAIREDLASVKDTLDLYMRGNQEYAESLPQAAESMRRIADTLGVLGLAEPRRIVGEQADIVGELGSSGVGSTVAVEKAAEALLYVESSLADLVERGRVSTGQDAGSEPGEALFDREYREVLGSTITHAITEVGRIKEGLVQFLENRDVSYLDGLSTSFEGVRGALSVTELTRASQLLASSERYVNEVLRPGNVRDPSALDDLADAVTSIEYYLEAVRDRRSGTEQILDVAAESLGRLGYGQADATAAEVPASSAEETGVAEGPGTEAAPAGDSAPDETAGGTESEADAVATETPSDDSPAAEQPAAVTDEFGEDLSKKRGRVNLDVPVFSDQLDEEILEIFVDEADEVLETLGECFPRWRDNPEDREALITTRRMFHTLKGSGRMAGGLLLGELAWAIENLLNRVLDQTLDADPAIPEMVEEAIGHVPKLVGQLRGDSAPENDVRELMRRAAAWSDPSQAGDAPPSSAPAPATEEEGSGDPGKAEGPEPDAVSVDDSVSHETMEAPGSEMDDAASEFEAGADPDASVPEDAGAITIDTLPPDEPEADDTVREAGPALEIGQAEVPERPEGGDVDVAETGWATDREPGAAFPEPGAPGLGAGSNESDTQSKEIAAELTAPESDTATQAVDSVAEDAAATGTSESTAAGVSPGMEPTLYEIFSKETLDHLLVVEEFLAECDPQACATNHDLLRSLHTLTGSARMAGADSISRLGKALEELARARDNNDQPLDPDDQDCMVRGAMLIRELVQALGREGAPLPEVEGLAVEVEQRRDTDIGPTLEAMTAAESADKPTFGWPAGLGEPLVEASFTSPADDPSIPAAEAKQGQAPSEPNVPLSGETLTASDPEPPDYAVATPDGAAAATPSTEAKHGQAPSEPNVPPSGETLAASDPEPPDYAVATPDGAAAATPSGDATAPAEAQSPASVRPADASAAPATPGGADSRTAAVAETEADTDDDLTSIFLEEAQDILDSFDDLVARWEVSPEPDDQVAELQRSLHTLKGGARLAALEAVGDFCHALETLASDVGEHRVSADDAFFEVLRDCIDELVRLVDVARQGGKPQPPRELVQRIEQLRSGSDNSQTPASEGPAEEAPPDQELLEVFLEEASDILDQSENLLQAWREAPSSTDQINELERALHTLKGGARMAGLQSVADLSHSLETLLKQVRAGTLAPNNAMFDLLDNANDRLVQLRDRAQAGERLAYPKDLMDAIGAIERGETPAGLASGNAASSAEAAPAVPAAEKAPAEAEAAEQSASTSTAQSTDQSRQQQSDTVRVRADLLDNLVNYAGEVSIYRARLEQQTGAINFNLEEFEQTVQRLRDQLRTLEIETESQIQTRTGNRPLKAAAGDDAQGHAQDPEDPDFDPLEMDRFSRVQELSRALSESVNDLASIEQTINNLNRESETLLLQQSRVNTDLQDGLMRTRMVPFGNLVPRLRRIVRQASQDMGKRANLQVLGAEGEMDRTVLERVVPPLEHMLRNSVAHGIEDVETRAARGKAEDGTISVSLDREGADVVIRVSDDGGGMDLEAIRRKALDQGFMRADAELTDKEVMQFVLESGFSTAKEVTQVAGRGVGMDVVNAEIKQLGGNLEIDSKPAEGTQLTVRLPFTLALNQAILCKSGDETYAIPLSSIEGVTRLDHPTLRDYLARPGEPVYEYAGAYYEVRSLSAILGGEDPELPDDDRQTPLILVQAGEHRIALQVDGLLGSRDIVVKSVGSQISTVQGIFGATILADGRVVLILDVSAMVRLGLGAREKRVEASADAATIEADTAPAAAAGPQTVMVVDDSITMRKVASRLLERNNLEVMTAKDGVDAVSQLQEHVPDAMLLDIEMPRMDGYELATHMRNDERLSSVPIVMITSRTGEKHRERAMDIGVDRYLGKPYQESDLLGTLNELLENGRDAG
jgi:chemosensory pili system protein ChpA (sensor histidine kinase/response regulator)